MTVEFSFERSLQRRRRRVQQMTLTGLLALAPVLSPILAVAQEKPASSQATKTASLPAGFEVTTPMIPLEWVGSLKSVNETMAKGVTPESNAVVRILQIVGTEALEPELVRDTLEALGVKALPKDAPLFISIEQYVNSQKEGPKFDPETLTAEIQSDLYYATGGDTDAVNSVKLKQYLEANAKALDVLVEASKLPHYFAPLASIESPPRLLSGALNLERRLQFLSRMLSARALKRIADGNFDAGLEDLLTSHRIAALVATGSPFDVSVAKAHVIDAITCDTESALLQKKGLTAAQLQKLAKGLDTLPKLPRAYRAIDIGERAIVHQEIELLSTDTESVAGFFEGLPPEVKTPVIPDLTKVQWDVAIQSADTVWDRIVYALKIEDRFERNEALLALDQQYAFWNDVDDSNPLTFIERLKRTPFLASRSIGESTAYSLRPLWWQRQLTDERAIVRQRLVRTAIALRLYELSHQSLPEKLEQLVPEFLAKLPIDAHSDEPLVYERIKPSKAVLQSYGPNLKSDAGQMYSDDRILQLH